MEQHSSERPSGVDRGDDAESESRARPPLAGLQQRLGNGAIQLMSRRAINQQRQSEPKVTDEEVLEVMTQEEGQPRDRVAEAQASADKGNVLSVIAEELEARY